MGKLLSSSPSKSAPSKKSRPNAAKRATPRSQSSNKLKALSTSISSLPSLRIPKNLPLLIVDNGGWTIKYGLVRPVETDPTQAAFSASRENVTNSEESPFFVSSSIPTSNGLRSIMSSMYNATAQPPHQLTLLTGDQITSRMKKLGQLSWNYSIERGMVCDGGTQLRVWARVLEVLGVAPYPTPGASGLSGGFAPTSNVTAGGRNGKQLSESSIKNVASMPSHNFAFVLLEPPFVPSVISEGVDRILFRELGMGKVARLLGACMAAMRYISDEISLAEEAANVKEISEMKSENEHGRSIGIEVDKHKTAKKNLHSPMSSLVKKSSVENEWISDGTSCCCVVDSGYSFTHVVPTHRGKAMEKAIRRMNIGGKVLTNLLKEAVTYRQWNMMDEYHIVNDAKEQLCFISTNFNTEIKNARTIRRGFRWFDREFLLPDFVNSFHGSVRLPAPLQYQKHLEEEKESQQTVSELKNFKERGHSSDHETEQEGSSENRTAPSSSRGSEKHGKQSSQSKSKRGRRKKKRETCKTKKKTSDTKDVHCEEADSMGDSDNDSDEETDQQRLQRLKKMREQEQQRREQEESERQALAMSVERFAIPEVLFQPSDIGLDCGGVAETIVESINACDPSCRAAMYHNVLLVGGNSKISGYKERVEMELRKLAPANYPVRIFLPEDPISYMWEGARICAMAPNFQERFCVDNVSWEEMKKAGKDQNEIWGGRIYMKDDVSKSFSE